MSKGTGIGVVILDVVVMDVSRFEVTIMGSDSVDCGSMGNLGVRVDYNLQFRARACASRPIVLQIAHKDRRDRPAWR